MATTRAHDCGQPGPCGRLPRDADAIADVLPASLMVDRVYLGETHVVEGARSHLGNAWGEGVLATTYLSHGSLVHLADENLFDISVAETLSNGAKLPLFVGSTCHIGRFDLPGFEPLSSTLLLNPSGGAMAVLAPGGASVNGQAKTIGATFLSHSVGTGRTLGQAMLLTFRDIETVSGTRELMKTYYLLGDPAIRLPTTASSSATDQP